MTPMTLFAVRSAVLALAIPGAVLAAKRVQDEQTEVVQQTASETGWDGDPYLLAIDPVTGEKLGDVQSQIVLQHEGREFRFASQETVTPSRPIPKSTFRASTRGWCGISCSSTR